MPDRSVDQATATAIERAVALVRSPVRSYGPVLEVFCPVAGTAYRINHRLGVVPDGWIVYLAVVGVVLALRVTEWTADSAIVTGSVNNTRARMSFVTFKSEAVNA